MKYIEIDTFFQNEGSSDCGPICMQMILSHFGIIKEEEEIKKHITYVSGGTYIYDNAMIALRKGLNVELVTANPLLFKLEDISELDSEEKVRRHIIKYKSSHQKDVHALELFEDYMSQGGEVSLEIPSIQHIKKAIDLNKLVLASVYIGALGRNEGSGFHYVVVSGYKDDCVYVNNPRIIARQGWFREKDFMYAVHSSTCVAVDNGSLIIVGK